MSAKPSSNRLLIAAPSLSAPDIERPRSGTTLCLSATALGLLVAACAGPYQQQRAALEPQHTHATCARVSGAETRHSCRPPWLAALSPGVQSALMNVPAPGRAMREEADTGRHPQSGSNRRSAKVAPAAANKAAPEVAPASESNRHPAAPTSVEASKVPEGRPAPMSNQTPDANRTPAESAAIDSG